MRTANFKHLITILALSGFGQTISAQTLSRSVMASGGGSFSGTSLQADWTIGEPVVGLFSGSNLLVCQGFQQGPDADATAIEQLTALPFRLWPNPTTGAIKLQQEGPSGILPASVLWSPDGRCISIHWVQSGDGIWQSNISHLAAGTYLLHIKDAEQSRVLRVVKY